MDAIEYFQRQRFRVDQLFDQLARVRTVSEREELIAQLGRAIRFHELLTERFLFPVLLHHLEDRAPLQEAHEEHAVLASTMRSLLAIAPGDARHEPLVRVLERMVRAHCDREEQLLFLPQRGLLNRTELARIGRQLETTETGRASESSRPPAPSVASQVTASPTTSSEAASSPATAARHSAAPPRESAGRSRWGLKRPVPMPFRHRSRSDAR